MHEVHTNIIYMYYVFIKRSYMKYAHNLWNCQHWEDWKNDGSEPFCPNIVRCLYVNIHYSWRDITLLIRGILVKLVTNIYHVSKRCWNVFQGQRSKVGVMTQQLTNNWPFWQRGPQGSVVLTYILYLVTLMARRPPPSCWCRPTSGQRSDRGRSPSLVHVSGTLFPLTLRLPPRWPSLDGV